MNKTAEIIEFYQQLALLVKSELPLPESLEQMGKSYGSSGLREVLAKLGEETAKGTPLSEAMKGHPEYFSTFHRLMLKSGEKSGTLAEVLAEVAYVSRLNYRLLAMMKEVAAYPAFTMYAAGILLLLILRFILPQYQEVFDEMFDGQTLPFMTRVVMGTSAVVVKTGIWSFVFAGLVGAGILALFIGGRRTNGWLNAILRALPFTSGIYDNLAMARVCSMLGVLMNREVPTVESLRLISGIVDQPGASAALSRAADKCESGKDLHDSLKEEREIASLIPVTIAHVPEDKLPAELGNLGEVYRSRASSASRRLAMFWEVAVIVIMALVIALVIIAMFLPLAGGFYWFGGTTG